MNYSHTLQLAGGVSCVLAKGKGCTYPVQEQVPREHLHMALGLLNEMLSRCSSNALPIILQPVGPTTSSPQDPSESQSIFRVASTLYNFSLTFNVSETSEGNLTLHSLIAERTDLVPTEKRRIITAFQSEDDGFSVKISPKNAKDSEEFSALVQICAYLEGRTFFNERSFDLLDFLKFGLRHY